MIIVMPTPLSEVFGESLKWIYRHHGHSLGSNITKAGGLPPPKKNTRHFK